MPLGASPGCTWGRLRHTGTTPPDSTILCTARGGGTPIAGPVKRQARRRRRSAAAAATARPRVGCGAHAADRRRQRRKGWHPGRPQRDARNRAVITKRDANRGPSLGAGSARDACGERALSAQRAAPRAPWTPGPLPPRSRRPPLSHAQTRRRGLVAAQEKAIAASASQHREAMAQRAEHHAALKELLEQPRADGVVLASSSS